MLSIMNRIIPDCAANLKAILISQEKFAMFKAWSQMEQKYFPSLPYSVVSESESKRGLKKQWFPCPSIQASSPEKQKQNSSESWHPHRSISLDEKLSFEGRGIRDILTNNKKQEH